LKKFYDVTSEGQTVGKVELEREGLYWHLRCRCVVYDNVIHRLYADGEKIGVLIRDGGELVLDTKVAAKRLKKESTFSLEEKVRYFIPIHPGEAYGYLGKLRLSKLAFREGEPGIFLD
jgi:hypothetical protein